MWQSGVLTTKEDFLWIRPRVRAMSGSLMGFELMNVMSTKRIIAQIIKDKKNKKDEKIKKNR